MCGRFSLRQTAAQLAPLLEVGIEPGALAWPPRYNIAPTQPVLAVDATRQLRLLRWGLIPSWAEDPAIGNKLINARAETVAEKPSFRAAFKQRRCLIVADGFYEWQRLATQKQPHYFQLASGRPFAFAGLWEHWEQDGTPVVSCTILTTAANALLEPIHDRMPVILPPDAYDRWLDPDARPAELQALLHPYDPAAMQSHPVSPRVNSPRYDQPDCVNSL